MGGLTASLRDPTRIGLDTSIFIDPWERHSRYFPLTQAMLIA